MPYRISEICLLILFTTALSILAAQESGVATSHDNHIMVGIAKQHITPDPAVRNWVTGEPYGKIHDSLFVTAVALGRGVHTVVLVSWPLVDAGESAIAELKDRVSTRLDINPERILVNATHNHSAPWSPVYKKGLRGKEVDPWWAIRYMPPQYSYEPYIHWMNLLMDQTTRAIQTAVAMQQRTTMWLGRSDISSLVQNRPPRPAASSSP